MSAILEQPGTSRASRRLAAGTVVLAGLLASLPATAATYYLQAENAEVVRGVSEKSNTGYTGPGYVNYADEAGSYVEWIVKADADASVAVRLRYANGSSASLPLRIVVNGVEVASALSFVPTGSWSTWRPQALGTLQLHKGFNNIRAEATDSVGGPNIDRLALDSPVVVKLSDWAQAAVDSTLLRYPNPGILGTSYPDYWRYPQGMLMLGAYRTFKRTARSDYRTYIRGWVDARTDSSGKIIRLIDKQPPLLPGYLDTVMPGRVALAMQREFGATDPRYGKVADWLWSSLVAHNRLPAPDNLLSHTNGLVNEVMLDGTYMALPFMASYGTQRAAALPGFPDLAGDILGQLGRLPTLLQDKAGTQAKPAGGTGLFYQAYDRSGAAAWVVTDATTNWKHSGVFWLRGHGWYAMALVDCLETLGGTPAQRSAAITALNDLAAAFSTVIDPAGSRWFNVVALDATTGGAAVPGNYLETSGSAMLVYSFSKAIEKGWIPASYSGLVSRAYKGVLTQMSLEPETLSGVQQRLTFLRGVSPGQVAKLTPAEYLQTTPVTNDLHGLGAFLLMYEQVRKAPQTVRP